MPHGLIIPGQEPEPCHLTLYGPNGELMKVGEVMRPIRARLMRLDRDGQPISPGWEVPVETLAIWRNACPADECPPLPFGDPETVTLDLELH